MPRTSEKTETTVPMRSNVASWKTVRVGGARHAEGEVLLKATGLQTRRTQGRGLTPEVGLGWEVKDLKLVAAGVAKAPQVRAFLVRQFGGDIE